jgi:hypothetical protein
MSIDTFTAYALEKQTSQICGIAPSSNKNDQVVITVQHQGIYLYDVYDQKSTKSWLLGRDTAFIHHAVQHPNKQIMNHFYAAQSTKNEGTVKGCLCKWVYEEDAKRMKKIEVDDLIHSILVDKAFREVFVVTDHAELIVFGHEGDVQSSAKKSASTPSKKSKAGDSSKAVWATLRVVEGDAFIFVVTYNEKAKSHELIVYSTNRNEETKKIEAKFLASHSYAEQVKVACCELDMETLTFCAIKSDHSLFIHKFKSTEELFATNAPILLESTDNIARKIGAYESAGQGVSGLTAMLIKSGVLAIVGRKAQTNHNLVTVWDTHFGTLLGSKILEFETKNQVSNDKLSIKQIIRSHEGNYYSICSSAGVIVATFSVEEPTLATCLGKFQPTLAVLDKNDPAHIGPPLSLTDIDLESSIFPEEESVAEPETVTQTNQAAGRPKSIVLKKPKEIEYVSLTPETWRDSVVVVDEKEQDVIQKLSPYEKNQLNRAKFMKIFNEYFEYVKEENEFKDHKHYSLTLRAKHIDPRNMSHKYEAIEQDQKKIGQNFERQEWRKIPKFSHNFIRTVSRICLSTENPTGYIWEPIAAFLKTRQVSAAAIPNLVPSILKAKKLDILLLYLANIEDANESDLVRILKFLISGIDRNELNEFWKKEMITSKKTKTGVDVVMAKFLNAVITTPYNNLFMQDVLRHLNLKEVLAILNHLHMWLIHYRHLNSKFTVGAHYSVPSLQQVISWITMLVDAHLAQLVLVDEGSKLVLTIGERIDEHLKTMEQMEMLRGCMNYYFSTPTRKLNDSQAKSAYRTEVLNI